MISAGHAVESSLYSITAVDDQRCSKAVIVLVILFKTHNPFSKPIILPIFLHLASVFLILDSAILSW